MELIIEPDISIIVPAVASGVPTLAFLNSVKKTLGFIQAEILVVDLTGGSLGNLLEADHPEIMVYERSQTETPGQATNQALLLAKGRYLSLWQPDTILQPDCLQTLLNFMDDTPECGLAGPRFFADNGAIIRSAGLFPSTLALIRLNLGLGVPRRVLPHPAEMFLLDRQVKTPAEVDWLMAGSLIIRRETFEEIGWPDPMLSEEFAALDLCRRAKQAGWHNHYIPTAEISKRTPPELTASWPDSLRYLFRSWRETFFTG